MSPDKYIEVLTKKLEKNHLKEIINNTKDWKIYYDKKEFQKYLKKSSIIKLFNLKSGKVTVLRTDDNIYYITFLLKKSKINFAWIICTESQYKTMLKENKFSSILEKIKIVLTVIFVLTLGYFLQDNIINNQFNNYSLNENNTLLDRYKLIFSNIYEKEFFGKDLKSIESSLLNDSTKWPYIYLNLIKSLNIPSKDIKNYLNEKYQFSNFYTQSELLEKKMFSITDNLWNEIDNKNGWIQNLIKKYNLKENTPYSYWELFNFLNELNNSWLYNWSLDKVKWIIYKFQYVPKNILNDLISNEKYKFLEINNLLWINQSYYWVSLFFNSLSSKTVWNTTTKGSISNSILLGTYIENNWNNEFINVDKIYKKYYESYLEKIRKIKKLDSKNQISIEEPKILYINGSIWVDLNISYKSNLEYLKTLKNIKKSWNIELFNNVRDLAWLDKRLLISTLNIQDYKKWYEQEAVKIYMDVFWMTENEFKRSIELWYNINLDTYLSNTFPNIDIYKKEIYYIWKEVFKNYYFKTLNSELINRDYNSDILHEIWHIIFDFNNNINIEWKKFSLRDYFINFDLLNSSTSVWNWKVRGNFLSKIYLEKLNSIWDNTPLWMTKYSTYNEEWFYDTIWQEYMTDMVGNFLTTPWYFAYIDLYWWEKAKITRNWIKELLNILNNTWIFSYEDYSYYKTEAIKLHEIINN